MVYKTLDKLEVLQEGHLEVNQLLIPVTPLRVVYDWQFFDRLWLLTNSHGGQIHTLSLHNL